MNKGDAPDPVVKLLDRVLEKMRVAFNAAVAAFQKLFWEALLPRVPAQHLPMMVSGAYNAVTQFRMIVWRMVVDKCIMPMRHTYLSSFSLATMIQHAIEKIPSICMMNIPPCPPEPKDDLTTFLDLVGGGSVAHMPAMPAVSSVVSIGTCNLTGTPDTGGSGTA